MNACHFLKCILNNANVWKLCIPCSKNILCCKLNHVVISFMFPYLALGIRTCTQLVSEVEKEILALPELLV